MSGQNQTNNRSDTRKKSGYSDNGRPAYRNTQSQARRNTGNSGRKSSVSSGRRSTGDDDRQIARRGLRNKKRKQRRRRGLLWLIVIILVAVAVLIALFISRKRAVEAYVHEDCIATGVTIDGVDVSGLTKRGAEDRFNERLEELGNIEFTFRTSGNDTDIALVDLGLGIKDTDIVSLVDEAYSVVRDGSVWKKYKQIKKLEKTGYNIAVSYELDMELASQVLQERCTVMEGAAENAWIEFLYQDNWIIHESVNGIVVEIDDTVAQLEQIISSWDKAAHIVEVVVHEDEPEITTADLEELSDVLSSYSTVYGYGNSGRVQNVETGTSHLDGIYLLPGEEVSVDALMGPYTEENGYTEAGSYEDGEVVQSMGGGICQVSSTLYNALLFAELEITQRSEHSMLVSYVQPGRDAAIADNVKDLKFKNNLDNPVYISGWYDGINCYFYVLGKETRDSDRKIVFRSDLITENEFKTEYENDPDLEEGKEKVKVEGFNGGTYKLYKEIYKNGEKVSEEYMTTSVYSPFNEVVLKGTKKVEKTDDTEKTEDSDGTADSTGTESDES